MSRTLVGVLAGCLVLAMAAVAGAGIPDADASYVTMSTGGKGLTTCPSGDDFPYEYITVTAIGTDTFPIVGIESQYIIVTVTGSGSANISIVAVDSETDINGEIRFKAEGTAAAQYEVAGYAIDVQIYTVVLADSDVLWVNTYDLDGDGAVTPIDLSNFAGKYEGTDESADFDWDGTVTPIDLSKFAAHYEH